MSNRYGITLDSEWIEWATKEKASETVAAAVLLICDRPVHEVAAKLTPGEFERVVDIVRRSPDHFPSGTLAALKSRGAMLARRPAADDVSTDQEPRQRPVGTSPAIASERRAHVLRAAHLLTFRQGQKNDFRDAFAVAEAVQRPTTRFVPAKTNEQLDLQALHRRFRGDARTGGRLSHLAGKERCRGPCTPSALPGYRHLCGVDGSVRAPASSNTRYGKLSEALQWASVSKTLHPGTGQFRFYSRCEVLAV